MSGRLTQADFAPFLGQAFTVAGWPGTLSLRNILAATTSADAFTLIFRGSMEAVLPEGAHALRPDRGPDFELHIMPIHTPSRDGQDYQAVFN